MKAQLLVFALAFISLSFSSALKPPPPLIPGVWAPVLSTTSEHIQSIAKFAIAEHNKQAYDGLVFLKVISGQRQIVEGMEGMNYRLQILAKREFAYEAITYEAKVWDKPVESFRKLIYFKKAKGTN